MIIHNKKSLTTGSLNRKNTLLSTPPTKKKKEEEKVVEGGGGNTNDVNFNQETKAVRS